MNRPIPTQPVTNKKQDERHPALLPVLAVISALCAVAAFIFIEDNYLKPRRDASDARRMAASEDPMFVPVDQYMDTMSVRSLDFSDPAVLELIKSDRDKPFDREPLNLGPPRQQRAVRELAIRREVPPYEEQITVWFVPERTPIEVLPRYYRAILTRGFQLPLSYNPNQHEQPSVPFPGVASDSSRATPSPPPTLAESAAAKPESASGNQTSATQPSDAQDLAGPGSTVNLADIPLPEPEIVTTYHADEEGHLHPTTKPLHAYNLMFSRRVHEPSSSGAINPYRAQSEVLIFRLVPVEGGTRMVSWLRTPIKDRASKKSDRPDDHKTATEPQVKTDTGSGKSER